METGAYITLALALLGAGIKVLLVMVDKRIADAVHQRVKMAAFSELQTEFREFKDEVSRSGVLKPGRRRGK